MPLAELFVIHPTGTAGAPLEIRVTQIWGFPQQNKARAELGVEEPGIPGAPGKGKSLLEWS